MAGQPVQREQADPVVHRVERLRPPAAPSRYFLSDGDGAERVGVKEDQQLLGEFIGRSKVNLPEPLGDVFQAGRAQPWPRQDDTHGVDVAAARHAAQQRGFQRRWCRGP